MRNRYVNCSTGRRGTFDFEKASGRDIEAFSHSLRTNTVRFIEHCERQPVWGDIYEIAGILRGRNEVTRGVAP